MLGIAEMFSEFSEPDPFESVYQLQLFGWRRRARLREYRKAWRIRHPDKARAARRRYFAKRYATDAAYRAAEVARQAKRYADDAEYRERRKEYVREYQRNRYATDPAYRERKLAAQAKRYAAKRAA